MKKLTFLATALSALFFAASCQEQEMIEPVAQETTVSYTVELPGVETRAIADGLNVDQLIYEVWKTEAADERDLNGTIGDGQTAKAIRLYQNEVPMVVNGDGVKSAIISLNLVQDQEYTILFWAQVEGIGVYDTEYLTNVHYEKAISGDADQLLSNQESYAAFYGIDFVSDEDPKSKKVVLKRPFAQLNLGTKNTADEYTVEVLSSKVIIANVGTSFNVAQNYVGTPATESTPAVPAQIAVGNPAEVTFDTATDPSGDDEKIMVNDHEYEYVAMNYLFATGNTVTVSYEIDAKLTGTNGQTTDAKVTNTVLNVPLQENYRTNIVGNLLTSTTDYEVVVDASWDDVKDESLNGDGYLVEVWDQKYVQEPYYNETLNQYEISLASELAWLAAAVNGKLPATKAETLPAQTFKGTKFVLKENIDLDGALWNPIGSNGGIFMGTFDGNNKTISNLTVATEGKASAGLFGATRSATIKNVTVVNANVSGHYKTGVIVGDGLCARIENCHVDGATVTVTPYEKDDANNVGGIVGYLAADGGTAYAKNCSVKDATITAYRKVGGLVGAANGAAEVSGNIIENVKVTADMTQEYMTVESAHAGLYAGYKHADAVLLENSKSENDENRSEVKVLVDSAAELSNGSGNSKETVYVFVSEGTIEFEENQPVVTVNGSIQTNPGETVTLNVAGNTIVSGTQYDYGFIAEGGSTLVINDANIDSKGGAITATEGANVTFNSGSVAVNTTSTSGRYNVYAVGNGTVVTINGGEFSFSKTLNQKRAYIYAGEGATVYVTGGTFGKASTRSGYTAGILGDGEVIITGGTFGFDPTQWVAAGYTAEKEGENWTVRAITAADVNGPLSEGEDVVFDGDYEFNAEESNSYGKTGLNQTNGGTIDGNGNTLSVPSASGTWDSAINTTGGTIKNLTIDAGFRGIFVNHNSDNCSKVYLDNVVIDGTVYTISCDQGSKNGLEAVNSTFNGWTSYAATIGDVLFTDCSFGEGQGYAYCRPYAPTTFVGCDFEAGYEIDARAEVTFVNCTYNGEALTPANVGTLVTSNVDKAKFTDEEGNPFVGSQDDLNEAIANNTTVVLAAGNYTMPELDLRSKTLTIKGSKDVVIDASAVDARNQFVTGATLKFEGVTLNFGKVNYMGFANTASLTYKGCDINGLQFLFGANVEFENCSLNSNGAEHTVWTYGAQNVSFTKCDFTYGDRGVNCYSDNDVPGGKQTVNFTDCTFATENTASEGAVEINSCFFSVGIEVNMEGCTAPVYGEMAYVSRWDSTEGAKTTINIK